MDNYIVINGKKTELTEEQLEKLGIKVEKKRNNPFNSELKYEDKYFIIDEQGVKTFFYVPIIDEYLLNNGNCFNDKDFANQVYLHELLNRKLLKYVYDNECKDNQKWNGVIQHYYITYNELRKNFEVAHAYFKALNTVYFPSICTAKKVIEEVIKPFMEEHKDFVW